MTEDDPSDPNDPVVRASIDTVMYGVGVMIMQFKQPGGIVIRHVPVEEYLALAESLRWAHDNSKKRITQ